MTAILYDRDFNPIYTFTEDESPLKLPIDHPAARMITEADFPEFHLRHDDGRSYRLGEWELRKTHTGSCPDCTCERELRIGWFDYTDWLKKNAT